MTGIFQHLHGVFFQYFHVTLSDRTIQLPSLVDITLSVPVEETAAAICDNWQKKNQEIYKYLITELF